MSLQYIIDAYNMINHPRFNARSDGPCGIQGALADFIREKRLAGSKNNKVILVFDGYPKHGGGMPDDPGMLSLFSRTIEADEKIKKLVEESAQRRNIIVVSDDRQVCLSARLLGARSCGVEEFISGGKSRSQAERARQEIEEIKISYTGMQKINAELKKRWLGG